MDPISKTVVEDCTELRLIAQWFEARGDREKGKLAARQEGE